VPRHHERTRLSPASRFNKIRLPEDGVRSVITFLATGAYVGLVPFAPGTVASLLALPLLLLVERLALPAAGLAGLLAVVVVAAIPVCHLAGRAYGDADSRKIVLDEICGMLVAGALIPPTARSLALTFLLFRLLDIAKPFPARLIDRRVKNGLGVVADDVVAGLYTNLLARVLA